MANHVDTIDISVENFTPKLSVQSFELSLAANRVPMIQLNVLPIEASAPASSHYITASAPNIQTVSSLYSKLLEKSQDPEKATATIKIKVTTKSDLPEEQNQEVTLTDWLLTDVGLSAIKSVEAPVLTVVFSHPSVMLTKTGYVYEYIFNPEVTSEVYKETGGDDILEFMENVYKKFKPSGKIEYYEIATPSKGGPRDEFKKRMEKCRNDLVEYSPKKWLKGNMGGKLFLQEAAGGRFVGNIREALGPKVAPFCFTGSTWERLMTKVNPNCLTTIVPTYDDQQLLMEPYSPWQQSTRKINTTTATDIEVSSIDPSPIIGTASWKDPWEEPAVIGEYNRDYQENITMYMPYAAYFPDKVVGNLSIKGEINFIGPDDVIRHIMLADRNANAQESLDGEEGEDLQTSGNAIDDQSQMVLEEAYTKAMFLINYRQNCKASVSLTPLFKDVDGKLLYPGRVLTVHDSNQEVDLFYGYITRVIIRGSTSGGGSTVIIMSHARAVDSASVLVSEGTENPCYPDNITRQ